MSILTKVIHIGALCESEPLDYVRLSHIIIIIITLTKPGYHSLLDRRLLGPWVRLLQRRDTMATTTPLGSLILMPAHRRPRRQLSRLHDAPTRHPSMGEH